MAEHTTQENELTSGLVVEQISWPHHHVLVPVNSLTKSSETHDLKNTGLLALRIGKQQIFWLWTDYRSRSWRKKQPHKHVADRLPLALSEVVYDTVNLNKTCSAHRPTLRKTDARSTVSIIQTQIKLRLISISELELSFKCEAQTVYSENVWGIREHWNKTMTWENNT